MSTHPIPRTYTLMVLCVRAGRTPGKRPVEYLVW